MQRQSSKGRVSLSRSFGNEREIKTMGDLAGNEREIKTMGDLALVSLSPKVPPDATTMLHARRGPHALHAIVKTISAALYILDFASNIAVVRQYYQFDYGGKALEGLHRTWFAVNQGAFIAMVCLMSFGHITCFVFFMVVGLPGEERQVPPRSLLCRAWSLYLLPVVQSKRALQGLISGLMFFHRSSCNANAQSFKPTAKEEDIEPPEAVALERALEARVEALYAIASATTDGGPIFLFQYMAISAYATTTAFIGNDVNNESKLSVNTWKPSLLLIASLCLSATSATWNVTRAIVFLLPSRSKWLPLAAGAFTFLALTIRCISCVSLLVAVIQLAQEHYTVNISSLPLIVVYLVLILGAPWLGYLFISRESTSDSEFKASSIGANFNHILKAAAFAWVSLPFGPLYPLLSAAQTTEGVSTARFRTRLAIFATCRWLLELSLVAYLLIRHWSPCTSIIIDYEFRTQKTLDKGRKAHNYTACRMMPCRLYVAVLAAALPAAILLQFVLPKLVQMRVTDTSKAGSEDGKIPQTVDGAIVICAAALDIVSIA